MTGLRLGVDFGTSNTVAVLRWPDGRVRPLLFDGSESLPSAVHALPDGRLLVGRDAQRAARSDPARFEPNPKRRIDHREILLGDRCYPVTEVIAAVLGRVRQQATSLAGRAPDCVVLTCPATWGIGERQTLTDASRLAGMPAPRLLTEPVAAATYLVGTAAHAVPPGNDLVIYDLGAGTFDLTVVRRSADGFEILDVSGSDRLGGLDLDAVIVERVGAELAGDRPELWQRITMPTEPRDRRHFRMLWEDATALKESLSRLSRASLYLPALDRDVAVTRDEFEQAATPLLARTVDITRTALRRAQVRPDRLAGLFLVGGATRTPLVATLLDHGTGIMPTALEQPETAVARGAVFAEAQNTAEPAAPAASQTTLAVPPRQRRPVDANAQGRLRATAVDAKGATLVSPASPPAVPSTAASASPASGPAFEPTPAPTLPPISARAFEPTGSSVGPRTRRGRRRGLLAAWIAAAVFLAALLGTGAGVLNTLGFPGGSSFAVDAIGRIDTGSPVWSLAFSPDGGKLVTGGNDKMVRIWSVRSRKQLGKPLGSHTNAVYGVAFSKDGETVASASSSGRARLWNAIAHLQIGETLEGHTGPIFGIAFSPDGRTVATGSADRTVRLWRVPEGTQRGGALTGSRTAPVNTVAFSPDSRTLASGAWDGTVQLWDYRTGQPIRQFNATGGKVYRLAFSPDGRTLATATSDGKTRLWKVGDGTVIGAPLVGHGGAVAAVAFSKDGKTLATGHNDRRVRVWDVKTGRLLGDPLTGHTRTVNTVAFSPDGETLASGGNDGSVRLWRVTRS